MPWTVEDVDKHMKDLSASQKETWVEVANDALARCLKEGRKVDICEGSAIRQANAVVGRLKEGEVGAGTTSLKERLRTALEEDDLVEAATFKTMVQGLLKSATGVATHKNVPKVVKAKIEELRTLLHKTWGNLSDIASGPEGKGAAAASEAADDSQGSIEEFVEVGAFVPVE